MLGLRIFHKSMWTIDCDACGVRFEPGTGGVCTRCQRILCPQHLHGSWLRRMAVDLGAAAVCVDCRAGKAPTRATGRTDGRHLRATSKDGPAR